VPVVPGQPTDQHAALAPAELREQYGEPSPIALALIKDHLDEVHQRFIAASPFVCVATVDGDGAPTVSPKGDAPGFVTILDDHTLLLPDRPGNNKILTLSHAAADGRVALLFFVPGVREMLRVHGDAEVTQDPSLLELGRANSRLPPSALLVRVRTSYLHCGKAAIRSKLWDPDQHAEPGTIPTLGKVLAQQRLVESRDSDALDEIVEQTYRETLY
jgi:PPOX class probable FMN-dependent enzyme